MPLSNNEKVMINNLVNIKKALNITLDDLVYFPSGDDEAISGKLKQSLTATIEDMNSTLGTIISLISMHAESRDYKKFMDDTKTFFTSTKTPNKVD